MNSKFVIIIGFALMAEGFLANIYSSTILFPPTLTPTMKPIEGIDYVLFVYRQAFLISGIAGAIVTVVGLILWKNRK